MAEAGPSSSNQPSTTSASPKRAAHIHFPIDYDATSQRSDSSPYGSLRSLGLGPPPHLRQPNGQSGSSSFKQDDRRRRVRSVDAFNGFEQRPSSSNRRTMSFTRRTEQKDALSKAVASALAEPFSEEYDLSREDPGVLEDVQRALRAKARREARIRTQSSPLRVESHAPIDVVSVSSGGTVPNAPPNPLNFPRQPRVSGDSDIDFSPSVGFVPLHPVPSSSDNGLTLDWSTPATEDGRERRWSLSRGKRRSKDIAPFSSSKAELEKQVATYERKLDQIRATVKPLTKRKVELITSQLERKYELLSHPMASPSNNLLSVVRWYRQQSSDVRSALDEAEPSTWMKHLWDKRGQERTAGNSAWSPTALVMAEYVKAHFGPPAMDTIPEDEAILPSSPNPASYSGNQSPSTSTYSWTTPRHSLEAAISRKRSPYDAQLSFEPMVESGRDSVGPDSRRSSDNFKPWKGAGVDSAQSSIYSMISRGASPNSSRNRIRDLGKRLTARGSDEALSSARNSISEQSGHSASEDGGHYGHQKMATLQPRSRPTSLQLPPSGASDTPDSKPAANGSIHPGTPDVPSTATQSGTIFPGTAQPTPRPEVAADSAFPPATIPRRHFRRSLPTSTDIFAREREKHRRSADEQKEREEYDLKAQVLEDTLSQNYRIRHLLQRVCLSVREYDSVQAGLSSLLGSSYAKIPPEVLDAFLHDPSAVTGNTRNSKGWRAVEDIHGRIRRQRETLQTFLHSCMLGSEPVTPPHNVFDEPIESLIRALNALAAQRQDLNQRAEETAAFLKQVKTVQASVKKDYNDTLAHTSLVYPELSQIAALEESYRNQFQQFWDIGLDALTLLLDTVTPFWRNYGKVIGEDVQDFLIIPWYRNEFTGEPKRYPIQQFPRRSFRHWIGLLFLSFLSISVAVLQTRFAFSLTVHIGMPWITHHGLWWIMFPLYIINLLIQWCAVLVELAILVAQSGVIVWWMGWSVNLFT